MIKTAVVAAVVFLLKVLAEAYLPMFPISTELINSLVLGLLGLFGIEVVEFMAKKKIASLRERGLWK